MFGKEERKFQDEELKKLHTILNSFEPHSLSAQIFEGTERFAKHLIQSGSGFSLMATIDRLSEMNAELQRKLRTAEQMEKASTRALQESRGNNTLTKLNKGDKDGNTNQ
ncbi:unnamed protein product [marine sediment metagenome]|uniref:Uncharacterized protein n=1 Tax=marine sediment metagenome TaxID=412755 RepID=X1BFG4_9ZZZZ